MGSGRILASANGGGSWHVQLSGGQHFMALDFISGTDGWVLSGSHLLVTTNGGACWRYGGEPSQPLRSVHFVSPSLGWGIAGGSSSPGAPGGGALVRSTDGGISWSAVTSAPQAAQSACFVNASDGWVSTASAVFRTQNGGASWQLVYSLPFAARVSTSLQCAAPSGVWVLAKTYGAAAGTSPWAVFSSQDGSSFHPVAATMFYGLQAPAAPGSYPGAISAISPSQAAILGYTPAISTNPAGLAMANGAQLSPRLPITGPLTTPSAASFLSATQGWAVGGGRSSTSASYIEHTSDGGNTWVTQYSAP